MVNNNNSSTKLKYRPAVHTYLFEVFRSPVFPLSGASVSPLFDFIFTVCFSILARDAGFRHAPALRVSATLHYKKSVFIMDY